MLPNIKIVILIFICLCPFLVYYLSCYNHRIHKAQFTTLIYLLFFPFYIKSNASSQFSGLLLVFYYPLQ